MYHRVQHNKGYTVLDNGFLQNRELSLKARGLLATILSLPDDWQFSVRGLEAILPDGRTSIGSAVHELEEAGHIRRLEQKRDAYGRMLPGEWDVYERPPLDDLAERYRWASYHDDFTEVWPEPCAGFPHAGNEPNNSTND